MSTYTPYPQPEPPAPPNPEPKRSAATKPLMIIIAVIGAITLVVLLVATLFSSLVGLSRGSANQTANTTGVTKLDLNSNAARVNIAFDDVDQATLDATGQRADRWQLNRRGDTLSVRPPEMWWSWCWFNCGETEVTLTLPQELNDGNLNAELDLNAGRLDAEGSFNELSLELNAGEMVVDGTARALQTEVNAGRAELQLADVETASFEVAAGRIDSDLTGTPPTTTEIDVSAGQLVLGLPDVEYSVITDASAGSVNNNLRTAPDAANRITVDIAAGDVTLRPGNSQ